MPVAVKLGPYFSSMGEIALRLDEAGADALVLFNRFLQPDIDPETLADRAQHRRSRTRPTPACRARGSRCCTAGCAPRWPPPRGVEEPADVARYLLAGADVVMTASALLRHGPEHAGVLLDGLSDWMAAQGLRLASTTLRGIGLLASRPGLALSAGGDAVVVWLARERAGCGYAVRAAVRRPGDRRFGSGRLVSAPCARAWNPRVALDTRGVGAIAWDQGPICMLASAGCRHAVVVGPLAEAGSPPRASSRGRRRRTRLHSPPAPQAGVLAWRAFERQGRYGVLGHVMATSLDSQGRTRPPRAISRSVRITDSPRLAVGPDGAVLAAWQSGFPVGGSSAVQVALRRRGRGAFTPADSLRAAGVSDARAAHLAAGLDRDAAAAVLHCDGSLRLVLDIRTAAVAMLPPERVGEYEERAANACMGGSVVAS